MPNSSGKEFEKTTPTPEKGKNSEKNKRKRNRNRKKNALKVENLVSKTFQAKLVANSNHTANTIIEDKSPSKIDVSDQQQCLPVQVTRNNFTVGSPSKDICSSDKCKSTPRNEKHSLNNTIGKKSVEPSSTDSAVLKTAKESPALMNIERKVTSVMQTPVVGSSSAEKSREEILAEREAKKLAKQLAKQKNKDGNAKSIVTQIENNNVKNVENQIKKPTRQTPKEEPSLPTNIAAVTKKISEITTSEFTNNGGAKDKIILTKAERRAKQEAQRAAKAEVVLKKPPVNTMSSSINEKKTKTQNKENVGHNEKSPVIKSTKAKDCKVKLFNHLESCRIDLNLFINNPHIHPVIVKLGEKYAKRTIVGSNARCISFLNALKTVIKDYETPAKKEFARSLEATIRIAVDHLHKCRPLAVSVWNAYKHIKHVLTQLPVDQPESELKEHLCHFVDTYIENQIGKAAEAISRSVQNKISNGDVILTFGCSSLINYIFEEAHRRHVDFRVIVVDSRPFSEGQELLRRLTTKEIPCTYVLINAVGFIMPEVTKILLGAHALLSNGYVMARTGTAQVALVAHSFNVPVLVCCETHKFSERFQTDAIVYNELGNPDDLIMSDKCRLMNWQSQNKLSPLNLNYDITPPELVTAVVTEVGILPCTSVPVILRIMPTEIGY